MWSFGWLHSVAIIHRTNAQSRALEGACMVQNARYLICGSAATFHSRAEVNDCLCFLKWLYNGRDRSALLRAIKTPSRGIDELSLNEFALWKHWKIHGWAMTWISNSHTVRNIDVIIKFGDNWKQQLIIFTISQNALEIVN